MQENRFLLATPSMLKAGDQIIHDNLLWEVRYSIPGRGLLGARVMLRGPTTLADQDQRVQHVVVKSPVKRLVVRP